MQAEDVRDDTAETEVRSTSGRRSVDPPTSLTSNANSRIPTVVKQVGAVFIGIVLAAVMLVLGVWQLRVYQESGDAAVQARIEEPALDLATVAPTGEQPVDAYGRTVRFSGHYESGSQVLVPVPGESGTFRVVTAFVQQDGTAVAVVRGVHQGDPAAVPVPPSGTVTQQGVLLPSEGTNDRRVGPGQLSSVRISVLAQSWSWPLVAGFVTLAPDQAAAHDLAYLPPEMPREGGELRNGAYAIQWWVFAAFAVGLGIKMARDFGREYSANTIVENIEREPTND